MYSGRSDTEVVTKCNSSCPLIKIWTNEWHKWFFVGEISGLLIRKINVKKSHYLWVSRYAVGFPSPVWTENKNPVSTYWHLLTRSWIPGSLTCHWITRFLVPDAVCKSNRNLVRMEYCQVWLHLFCKVVVGEPRRVEDWGSKFIKQTDVLFRASLLINVVSKYMCGIFGLRLGFIISWQGRCWVDNSHPLQAFLWLLSNLDPI